MWTVPSRYCVAPAPLTAQSVFLFPIRLLDYRRVAGFASRPCPEGGLRARRLLELELAEDAAARGWEREVERHRCAASRIEQLLCELKESLDEGEDSGG